VMDTDTLKVFAITYIMEQENVDIKTKCHFVKFVKEAEQDEILHLIFNGRMPKENLNEADRFVLRSQAENFIFPLIHEESGDITINLGDIGEKIKVKGEQGKEYATKKYNIAKAKAMKYGKRIRPYAKGVGVAVIVAAVTASAYQIYKRTMSAAARSCRGKKGNEKRNCMVVFHRKALQLKLATLQKLRSECNNSKNPQKCKNQLDAKIKKVRYKIATLQSKY